MKLLAIAAILGLAVVAMAETAATQPIVPPETEALFQEFLIHRQKPNWNEGDPTFRKLITAPDADLCFSRLLGDERASVRVTAFRGIELARSTRKNAFALEILKNKEANRFARRSVVQLLRANLSAPGNKELLLELMAHDPDAEVRSNAAEVVGRIRDENTVNVLMAALEKDPEITGGVLLGLVDNRGDKYLPLARKVLKESKDWRIHNDAVMAIRLCIYQAADQPDREILGLLEATKILRNLDLPFDGFLADRMNDELELFKPPQEKLDERTYTKNADDLKLAVELDSEAFRPNEPIRIHMRFENTSEKYASVVVPSLTANGYALEGIKFAITDLATGKTVYEKESYKGIERKDDGPFARIAPQITRPVIFGPHEIHQEYRCLQNVLAIDDAHPLPAGTYSLTFSCDFSGLAGASKQPANDLTHQWMASVVKFTVKGEPMKDRKELLSSIDKKAGIENVETELLDYHRYRSEYAWESIREYGNDELHKYYIEKYPAHFDIDEKVQ